MITKMNKMAAAEQHEFVYQQQIQILQQALRGSAMSTAPPPQNQQLPQQPPPQQQQQNNTDTLHQQSSPKPGVGSYLYPKNYCYYSMCYLTMLQMVEQISSKAKSCSEGKACQ